MRRKRCSSFVAQFLVILLRTLALLPAAWAQNFEVLYDFKGGTDWGALDNALVFDRIMADAGSKRPTTG
jgi:hypothetical protein